MKQIIISYHPSSTKVCIVEDGKLVEFWVERVSKERLVGNIYKGKVMNVLPGMDSAFVNIGLEKNAFLYAGDMLVSDKEVQGVASKKLNVKVGDEILVQVVKDQFGNKGARISMNMSLAGRLLILMPQIDYVAVSRKIEDENLRSDLINFVEQFRKPGHGYIVRTQAITCSKEELLQEAQELEERWEKIQRGFIRNSAPNLIYKDEDLATRAVRDMLRSDVDEIIVDNKQLYDGLISEFPHVYNSNSNLFKLYEDKKTIIDAYELSKQIDDTLQRKVELSNGAYLVIDRTEALTVIDVNTGRYVGDKDLQDTLFETNKIAAKEIARQLRLRNIGGIIVVDFIDMEEKEHEKVVLEILEEELKKDRIKASVIDITPLGLVEITRKKARSMLGDVMLQPCPYCNGNGYVYSDEHVVTKLKKDLTGIFVNNKNTSVIVTLSINVFNKIFAHRLLERECANEWRDKRIYLVPNQEYHIEKYDMRVTSSAILNLPDEARLLY